MYASLENSETGEEWYVEVGLMEEKMHPKGVYEALKNTQQEKVFASLGGRRLWEEGVHG